MKTTLAVLAIVIVLGVIAWRLFFPQNTFFLVSTSSGRGMTISRSGISMEPAPDRYASNGLEHIGPYITRLLVPTEELKAVAIFTPDGNRGFGLDAQNGQITANLTVEWRQEAKREAAIRAFFNNLKIQPSRDYLAGNGGVADATRCLEYPIQGTATEITELTQRILQELCGVSRDEALNITYRDK